MNNKKDSMQFENIEPDFDYLYYTLYNIIYQNRINVQYKWKKYFKKDLYARYNHRIPAYIPTWKVYDTSQLIDSLPGEIERVNPIIPPDGYKVTKNTKIKYLEAYPEFMTHVDRFITRLDENDNFADNGIYLINYFREHGYDDGITEFYEERFEMLDGNITDIFGDFTTIYKVVIQHLKDKYEEIKALESGKI